MVVIWSLLTRLQEKTQVNSCFALPPMRNKSFFRNQTFYSLLLKANLSVCITDFDIQWEEYNLHESDSIKRNNVVTLRTNENRPDQIDSIKQWANVFPYHYFFPYVTQFWKVAIDPFSILSTESPKWPGVFLRLVLFYKRSKHIIDVLFFFLFFWWGVWATCTKHKLGKSSAQRPVQGHL